MSTSNGCLPTHSYPSTDRYSLAKNSGLTNPTPVVLQQPRESEPAVGRWSGAANRTIVALLSGLTRIFCGTHVDDPHGVLRVAAAASATESRPPRIYIANHSSHADFLVFWTSLPTVLRATVRPVAATDYWLAGPLRRYLSRHVFRAVLVDRRDMDARRNPLWPMLDAIERGDSLILFPEGSRGDGAAISPFRCGLYHLARAIPGLEIVPVWIENTAKVLPRHAWLPAPVPCKLRFGAALRWDAAEDKQRFLERAREAVIAQGTPCYS